MADGGGRLHVNTTAGQRPVAVNQDTFYNASRSLLEENFVQAEEGQQQLGKPPRPDSWSSHDGCTPQPGNKKDKMSTSTRVLNLPTDNASRDFAFSLQTTAPLSPFQESSKMGHPKRAGRTRKNVFRFMKLGQKRPRASGVAIDDKPNGALRNEDSSLKGAESQTPYCVGQEQPSSGQRVAAPQIQLPTSLHKKTHSASSNDAFESHGSVLLGNDMQSTEHLDDWLLATRKRNSFQNSPWRLQKSSAQQPPRDEHIVHLDNISSPSVHEAASNLPTVLPMSAIPMLEPCPGHFIEHPRDRSSDALRASTNHHVHKEPSLTALPKISLSHDTTPGGLNGREIEDKGRSLRHLASQPALLQRASSVVSFLRSRNSSDSPGSPPPCDQARPWRDPRYSEGSVTARCGPRETASNLLLDTKRVDEHNKKVAAGKDIFVTTSPKRAQKGSDHLQNRSSRPSRSAFLKDHDRHTRGRKLRNRPYLSRTNDGVLNSYSSHHRLGEVWSRSQSPCLPSARKSPVPSQASGTGNWKRNSGRTYIPMYPVHSPNSEGDQKKSSRASILATSSQVGTKTEERMTANSVTPEKEDLVPKVDAPAKPPVREGRTYAARPRSASMSRNTLKTRSRSIPQSVHTSPRAVHRAGHVPKYDILPLPSAPPDKALPPTPPRSREPLRSKYAEFEESSVLLTGKRHSNVETSPRINSVPHVATLAQRENNATKHSNRISKIDARLEALERQNSLLSSALVAVLKANGALNGQLSALEESESSKLER